MAGLPALDRYVEAVTLFDGAFALAEELLRINVAQASAATAQAATWDRIATGIGFSVAAALLIVTGWSRSVLAASCTDRCSRLEMRYDVTRPVTIKHAPKCRGRSKFALSRMRLMRWLTSSNDFAHSN